MLGLGSSISRSGKVGPTIIRDGLVLKHDYNAGAVEPCSTGAASFDGADDYIDLGTQSATADMTISAWIFKTSDDANPVIRYGKSLVRLEDSATTIRFWGDTTASASSTSNVQENNVWQHWCFTITGTTANIYKNGVFLEADTITAVDTAAGASYIGRHGSGYFNGNICNVGYWNAALTQPQIKSIMHKDYAALSASEKTSLVSWWNLDSVIDSVGASTAVYDNHYAGGSKLGTELVTDGSFANGLDSWSSANVTLSGSSVILYDDDADYVFQNISYTDGEVYAFTFEGTGNVQNRIGYSGTAATKIPVTLPATIYRLADSNANRVQLYGAADDSSATVTSMSVKLVNGNTGTLA